MKVVAMKCVVGGSFRRLTARQLRSLSPRCRYIQQFIEGRPRRGAFVLYCATLLLKKVGVY